MFYIVQILWVLFIFFIVDQKIASFFNSRFQVYKWFLRSNSSILVGIVLFFITLMAVSLVLLMIFGDNFSTNYFYTFIEFTMLALIGGTVFRVIFKM